MELHDTARVPFYQRVSYLFVPAIFVMTSVLLEVMMFAMMEIAFPKAYIFSLAIILLVAALVSLIRKPWVQTVICSLLLAWQLVTTISNIVANKTCMEIFSLETLKTLELAFNSIGAVDSGFWFVLPILALMVVYVIGVVWVIMHCQPPKIKRGAFWQSVLCGVLAFVSFFSYTVAYSGLPGYRRGTDYYVANLSNEKFLYDTFSNRVSSLRTFGSYSYYLDNFLKLLGAKTSTEKTLELKVNQEFQANPAAENLDEDELLGDGYNLIMILMETFERSAVNPVTMPNLYRFMKQSCTEVDGYYSIERTCFTDHIGQTGMLPAGKEVWNNYGNVEIPHSLANIFGRSTNNYQTAVFHDCDGSYYHRKDIFTKSLGFQKFYDFNDYDNPRYTSNYALNSDNLLFEKNLERIAPADQNFYSYIISVSTHAINAASVNLADYPHYKEHFDFMEQEENWETLKQIYPVLANGNAEEVLTAKNYLAGTRDFDMGFGKLLERLKTTPDAKNPGKMLIETTAIVMFGDHYYYVNPTALEPENTNPRELAGNRSPLIVYNPNQKVADGTTTQAANLLSENPAQCGETLVRFSATMDLYPTVCSLFGVATDQQLTYGHSIFSNETTVGVGYLGGFTWGTIGTNGSTTKHYTYQGVEYADEKMNWQLWRTLNFVDYNGVTLKASELAEITPAVNRTYASIYLNTYLYDHNGFKNLEKSKAYCLRTTA